MTAIQRWIKNIALILVSVTIAILICEAAVRLLGLGGTTLTRGMLHQYDPDAGWRCYPDLDAYYVLPDSFKVRVRSNSKGLRDSEKPFSKAQGVRRIVVLGDSFMWGYGVENEETFSAVLQETIPGSETINFGVNGYGTVQELIRLETEGLKYKPDVTVLTFVWNDLEDNFDDKNGGRPIAVIEQDNSLRIENRPVRKRWKSPIKQWFRHHSHLFRFVEYRVEILKHMLKDYRRAGQLNIKVIEPGVAFAAGNSSNMAGVKFSMIDIYDSPSKQIDQAWKVMHLLLDKMNQLATRDGGRLVVVYAASIEAVNQEIFTKLSRKTVSDKRSEAIDWDRPSKRLGEICKDLQIQYINLNPVFRRHNQPSRLFLKRNPHWSAAGHRLAAETVAATIGGF